MKPTNTANQEAALHQTLVRALVVMGAVIVAGLLAVMIGMAQFTLLLLIGVPLVVMVGAMWMRDRAWG